MADEKDQAQAAEDQSPDYEPTQDELESAVEGDADTETGETEPATPPAIPDLILGKYKSVEDLTNAHKELQTKLGEQGNELGMTRKQMETLLRHNEMLAQQAQERQRQQQQAQTQPPDPMQQLAAIQRQVDNGDLTISEAIAAAAQISAQMGEARATQGFKTVLAQMQAQHQQQQQMDKWNTWVEKNPDFAELQQSGVLNPLMKEGLNAVEAYYAYTKEQAINRMTAEVEAARKQGKLEQAKVQEGGKKTPQPLSQPGAETRHKAPPKGPKTEEEIRASMLAAVRAVTPEEAQQ